MNSAASATGYDLSVTSASKAEGIQLKVETMNLSMSADIGVFGGYEGVFKLLKDIAQKFPNQTRLQRWVNSMPTTTRFLCTRGARLNSIESDIEFDDRYFHRSFPLHSLGSSNKKYVWLLEISSTPTGPHDSPHLPGVLVTAGHHGSDVAAIQTALNLARLLTSRYDKDKYIRKVRPPSGTDPSRLGIDPEIIILSLSDHTPKLESNYSYVRIVHLQIVNSTKIFIVPMIDVDSVPDEGQSVGCDSKYNFSSYQNVFGEKTISQASRPPLYCDYSPVGASQCLPVSCRSSRELLLFQMILNQI